jgi:Icc protein
LARRCHAPIMSSYQLAWCSDLHFDFLNAAKQTHFLDSLRSLSAAALVITGDISNSLRLGAALDALATVGKPVYFVLGNHDYYCSNFASTEAVINRTCQSSRRLVRLGRGEIIPLSSRAALIGHGGWADGRAGLGRASLAQLNDFLLIKDLKVPKEQLFDRLNELGQDSARYLTTVLPRAAAQADHIIVATHVPPFVEAARYGEAPCSPGFQPHYVNLAFGEALLEFARGWPRKKFTVLCGHTHEAYEYQAAPNLLVRVAGADYSNPRVEAVLDL